MERLFFWFLFDESIIYLSYFKMLYLMQDGVITAGIVIQLTLSSA